MSCYWDPTEIKVTRGPRINSSHTLRALSGQNKYPKKTLSHIFLFIAARNVNNNDQYGDVKKGPFRTQICVKLTRMKDELQDYSSLQRWQFLTKYKSSQPAPIYRSMFSHNSVEQIEIVTWQELISRDLFLRKMKRKWDMKGRRDMDWKSLWHNVLNADEMVPRCKENISLSNRKGVEFQRKKNESSTMFISFLYWIFH